MRALRVARVVSLRAAVAAAVFGRRCLTNVAAKAGVPRWIRSCALVPWPTHRWQTKTVAAQGWRGLPLFRFRAERGVALRATAVLPHQMSAVGESRQGRHCPERESRRQRGVLGLQCEHVHQDLHSSAMTVH